MTENNDIEPRDRQNPNWRMVSAERVSACDNRPGLKNIYVTILNDKDYPVIGVQVRFDTEPSYGIAYDHADIRGVTDLQGHLVWDHLGIPTRYRLFMENDTDPLIENIRTDLGNEYCKPAGSAPWSGNRPVNSPGIYSYRIEIRRRY